MAVENIGEQLMGAVDNTNRVFSTSLTPNVNTLVVYVDMVAVEIESIDPTGQQATLVVAPTSGQQVFGTYQHSTADDIDLTTLAAVKAMAEVSSTKEDSELQDLITSFSRFAMNYTGCRVLNRVLVITDDDPYSGKGGTTLFLRQYPLVSIQAVIVNGQQLPISTGRTSGGVAILDREKSGITIRRPMGGMNESFGLGLQGCFAMGNANIYVDYTAGNNGTPPDLEMAARTECAIAYKRKLAMDLKSKSLSVQGGAGTTSYRDWDVTPRTQKILNFYTRKTVC